MQNFLIAIIVVAMVDFMVGTFMGPKDVEEISKGFVGLSGKFKFYNVTRVLFYVSLRYFHYS